MKRTDKEESSAHCKICANAISEMEKLEYGDTCVFCGAPWKHIGLLRWLAMNYIDWKTHCIKQRLQNRNGDKDIRFKVRGVIGEIGFRRITDVTSVWDKYRILRKLKRL
jgi:hypothetical protein